MIKPNAKLCIRDIPTHQIVITEHTPLDFDRVLHYLARMTLPENEGCAPGLVHVEPLGENIFGVLDGRHRLTAHVILGRPYTLCAVVDERKKARANRV